LTQEEIAEALSIIPRHYQKLEAAEVTPTFGILVRLKKILKCEWDALLAGA